MHTMRLVFSLLVVSFTVSSVQALEWVEYEGTIPENAVSVNEGTEDRPVCRRNSRIGIVNDAGKCYSVKVGGGVSKKTEDDGYQILVDNPETVSFEWDWMEFDGNKVVNIDPRHGSIEVYNNGGTPFYEIKMNQINNYQLSGVYFPLLRVNGEQWGFQTQVYYLNSGCSAHIRMKPPTAGTCSSSSKYGCEY